MMWLTASFLVHVSLSTLLIYMLLILVQLQFIYILTVIWNGTFVFNEQSGLVLQARTQGVVHTNLDEC